MKLSTLDDNVDVAGERARFASRAAYHSHADANLASNKPAARRATTPISKSCSGKHAWRTSPTLARGRHQTPIKLCDIHANIKPGYYIAHLPICRSAFRSINRCNEMPKALAEEAVAVSTNRRDRWWHGHQWRMKSARRRRSMAIGEPVISKWLRRGVGPKDASARCPSSDTGSGQHTMARSLLGCGEYFEPAGDDRDDRVSSARRELGCIASA